MVSRLMLPKKIAALNWRWRIQFGRRGFEFGLVSFVCSLPAPVSELVRRHMRVTPFVILVLLTLVSGCKTTPRTSLSAHPGWSVVAVVQGTPAAGHQVDTILGREHIPFMLEGSIGWQVYVPLAYERRAEAELMRSFPTNEFEITFIKP
jgi:hypothetical protein